MNKKKVWVINDVELGVNEFGSIVQKKPRGEKKPATRRLRHSPALSFSISLFFWGGGQLYLGNTRLGICYLGSQATIIALLIGGLLAHDPIGQYARQNPARIPMLVFVGLLGMLMTLIVWVWNADEAYRHNVAEGVGRYAGLKGYRLPFLASLLVPGWGQYLNGQRFRGAVYLSLGMFAVYSAMTLLSTRLFWPFVPGSRSGILIEVIILVAVSVMPIALMAWLVSIYDIFRTRIGDIIDSPLPSLTALSALALTIVLAYFTIPDHYYHRELEALRQQLIHMKMSVIPGVIEVIQGALTRII